MPHGNRVQAVIRSASRQRFLVLAVEHLGLAVALILAGGILLLLLGTQILDWYWLVFLGVIGLMLASVRIRSRMVTRYRVAQLVDRRLQLSDSLSTAWFLLSSEEPARDLVASFQLERADEVAASVDPRKAFPFVGRRTWVIAAGLAAVAFGLFAVRYLVISSLSLREPLVAVHFGAVFERVEQALSAHRQPVGLPSAPDHAGVKSSEPAESRQSDEQTELRASQQLQSGKPDGMSEAQSSNQSKQKTDSGESKRDQNGQTGNRDGSPSAPQSAAENKTEPSRNQAGLQQASEKKEQQGGNQEGSSGLMDKMKDALSSLMAKLRPNESSQKSLQNSGRSSDDQKGGDQTAASRDQQGRQQQNARSERPGEQQSSQGEAKGEATEKGQAAQGRNSDQSPDQKGADAHSGVGRQDGDKDIKEAEQLKTMGKLAEIIGKRSANVTGEMMVETLSGKQQLKTEYSQRMGHHSDLGGEINRDEIPLMDQQYVREYMEQVRKQQEKKEP
ncbi:MAG: hypothetical protein WB992_16495 [Bryobacteraceae bacterium]